MTSIATKPVYLDYNATTPVDPAVLKAMLPYLGDEFGNPSSAHALGRRARDAVEAARAEVASLIGAVPGRNSFHQRRHRSQQHRDPRHRFGQCRARGAIVTTAIEHPATEACCAFLEAQGHKVTRIDAERGRGGGSGNIRRRDRRRHRARHHHPCAKRDRHAAAGCRNQRRRANSAAHRSMSTRRNRSERSRSTSMSSASICSRSPDTSSMRRRASARCTSGAASICLRCCSARARNTAAAPAPKTLPTSSRSARPAGSPKLICRAGCTNSRALPTNSTPGSSARYPASGWWVIPTQRLPNTLNVLFPGVSGRRLLEHCPGVLASNGSACHADSEEPSAILTALGIPPRRGTRIGTAVARPAYDARRYRDRRIAARCRLASSCNADTPAIQDGRERRQRTSREIGA